MKSIIPAVLAVLLSGCASLEGKLDNRVVCTAAGDKAYALSEYGPLSVGAQIAEADRAVICKASAK
jgi:hypothetical protein